MMEGVPNKFALIKMESGKSFKYWIFHNKSAKLIAKTFICKCQLFLVRPYHAPLP